MALSLLAPMRGLRRKSKTGILFGLYTMFLIGANIFEIGAYTFPFKKVKIVGISLKKKNDVCATLEPWSCNDVQQQ